MVEPQSVKATGEGFLPYIHEAEERTKKKFLEIKLLVSKFLKKLVFFPLLCATSPVAGFPLLGDFEQMLD